MEKERARLQEQIHALERQIEDLKDQNVQLQYKMEFASDPMLLERLQDATDMRCVACSFPEQWSGTVILTGTR